uniref:Uncharacterized protein n=1 Tax=Oryza sativa subsp. japonica TaxID=39947 RepID=Q84ZA9_ORYSJ|nr:hypothetical protein [Oryza sativa Japonica Group]
MGGEEACRVRQERRVRGEAGLPPLGKEPPPHQKGGHSKRLRIGSDGADDSAPLGLVVIGGSRRMQSREAGGATGDRWQG